MPFEKMPVFILCLGQPGDKRTLFGIGVVTLQDFARKNIAFGESFVHDLELRKGKRKKLAFFQSLDILDGFDPFVNAEDGGNQLILYGNPGSDVLRALPGESPQRPFDDKIDVFADHSLFQQKLAFGDGAGSDMIPKVLLRFGAQRTKLIDYNQ
jgi:hypothetical protein